MSAVTGNLPSDEVVAVTVHIPKAAYDEASQTAQDEELSFDAFLSGALLRGLNEREKAHQAWRQASDSYRARLADQGKLDQTGDEVLQELSGIREEIADELYPELSSSRTASTKP